MKLALAALALLSACDVTGTFKCDSNEDCRQRGETGTCQTSVSACSFADATCPSGQRFSSNSGAYSDECYSDGGSGSATPDARPPFDPADCPATFPDLIDARPNARFGRFTVSSTTSAFKNLLKLCNQAFVGASHPVNVGGSTMYSQLHQKYGVNFYIGLVQDPSSTVRSAGWVNFDGSALDEDLWESGSPDDGGGTPTGADTKAENFGEIVAGGINDVSSTKDVVMICQCDGVAVPATVNAFLTALGAQ